MDETLHKVGYCVVTDLSPAQRIELALVSSNSPASTHSTKRPVQCFSDPRIWLTRAQSADQRPLLRAQVGE